MPAGRPTIGHHPALDAGPLAALIQGRRLGASSYAIVLAIVT